MSDPTAVSNPVVYVRVEENSLVGTVIWQGEAIDPDGTWVDYWDDWLTGYVDPVRLTPGERAAHTHRSDLLEHVCHSISF